VQEPQRPRRRLPLWLRIILIAAILLSNGPLRTASKAWTESRWQAAKPRLTQDLRTLDPLLHALEQYRIDHPAKEVGAPLRSENYPATLQELVPRYLKALPTLPSALSGLKYEQTQVGMFGTGANCELLIPLRPRTKWLGLLGVEPKGTLVYRGVHWIDLPGPGRFALWGRPTERLAGWGYYPAGRAPVSSSQLLAFDAQQEMLKPYRATRLRTLEPVTTAFDRFRNDRKARHQYPLAPKCLQELVPRYLKALPKLPPSFGPLHYEYDEHGVGWLWVVLREQVTDPAGKPLDISAGFSYTGDGSGFDLLLDRTAPNSRPLRRVGTVDRWAVYD